MEKSAGKWKKVIGNCGKKCLKWHKMLINGKKSRVNEKVSINGKKSAQNVKSLTYGQFVNKFYLKKDTWMQSFSDAS
jgi:hypothetical protein